MKEYYKWFEKSVMEGTESSYLTPEADPMIYEYPFDYMFRSIEAAFEGLSDFGVVDTYWEGEGDLPKGWHPEHWVLCKVTITEV